jgi:hypothetical protein
MSCHKLATFASNGPSMPGRCEENMKEPARAACVMRGRSSHWLT